MTGLYERSQALQAPDVDARAASAEFAYCELLLSGVTSLVDISAPWDGWVELFAQSGMRGFLAPGYASARWYLKDDHELHYDWDEARGRAGFDAALGTIDRAQAHACGRLSGIVSPMQMACASITRIQHFETACFDLLANASGLRANLFGDRRTVGKLYQHKFFTRIRACR